MSYHSDVAHNMYRFYTQLSLLFFPDLTFGGQSAERVSTDSYTRKVSCVGIEIAGGRPMRLLRVTPHSAASDHF